MSFKAELICNICKLVLSSTPVLLPCSSAVCGEHLRDGTIKEGSIRCLECVQEFEVPQCGFPPHKMASNILAKDLHLSEEEKTIKTAIQELVQQLEQLQSDLKQIHSDLKRTSFAHFSDVRHQIEIQREELKNKIDEFSLKMIDQVNEKEKAYNLRVEESLLVTNTVDIEESRRILENKFRNPNLVIDEIKRLQTEHEQNLNEFRARLTELVTFNDELKTITFKTGSGFQSESFGRLALNELNSKVNCLVACSNVNSIQIWNLVSNECVATLEGHSTFVHGLENIDENRFASGSMDKTIRIWNANSYVCFKILKGHQYGVEALKCLTSNRLASGSHGEIKIWDVESEECLQTLLNAHLSSIRGLASLPNGNLVSCSDDKTIKVWDLNRGACIKTLTGHLDVVFCILLLKNGQLASGSQDRTIKIWNMAIGECVKTFEGHTDIIWRLQQLESGELVSCSWDYSIKIWNLTESVCVRTLVSHTSYVTSIRVNSQNNTLVSCSSDGTIKAWDLETGECANNVIFKKDAQLRDLILI